MCVQSPITLGAGHLLLCNKSQNMLGLAWVKQVIPKNTYNICVEKLLFIDHIKRHQASSMNFWETGAAECAWWSFHTARWYTTAFESSSAHLWLSNHKGCLGFGEILGLSIMLTMWIRHTAYHSCGTGAQFQKRTFFREGARSHALVGWIRDTIPMEVLQAGCLLTITLLILWCWIAEPKKT